jgi:hypothetical protein
MGKSIKTILKGSFLPFIYSFDLISLLLLFVEGSIGLPT